MNREEYNACISKHLTGKKFTPEERKMEFCIVAKTCSGKVKSREEAMTICSLPKEPKEPRIKRSRAQSNGKDVLKVAQCMVKVIDRDLLANEDGMKLAIANALDKC